MQFEVFCKRTLTRELADIVKEVKRRNRRKQHVRETPLSCLEEADARQVESLCRAQESTLFHAAGYEIPIKSDRLADALLRLTESQRQTVLLSECCGEPDRRIGERLGISKSTVWSYRKKALERLRGHLK